jgi:hypothetical protein
MKKIKGDEPILVIIHIKMEISQETPCVATLFKQAKIPVFLFILCLFSSTRSENRSCRVWGEGLRQWKGGGGRERRGGRVNMVQKMCTHVSQCKYDTC